MASVGHNTAYYDGRRMRIEFVGHASNDKAEMQEQVQVDYTIQFVEKWRWMCREARGVRENIQSEITRTFQLPTPNMLWTNTTYEAYILGSISSLRLPEEVNYNAKFMAFTIGCFTDIAMHYMIKKTSVTAAIELVREFTCRGPGLVDFHGHETVSIAWYYEQELTHQSFQEFREIEVPFVVEGPEELAPQTLAESEESHIHSEEAESSEWERRTSATRRTSMVDQSLMGEPGQEIEPRESTESEELAWALEESAQQAEFRAEPVTKAGIEALVIEKYRRGASNETCSVCMENFLKGEEVTLIPCQHAYHWSCILRWLSMSNTCPLCRFKLP